ncbi:MAG: ATP-binding cassette domain-containing protein [Candidatus Accumulibacter sp.]|jgi:ABC-2 type transport system ATP-binding protein|nr:ATP-binding cassette domain-containing protein [Accumulibacter sp.]
MIQLENLVKRYGQNKALDGLSLSVAAGESFAFLGPNGAGKTTVIRILNGMTAMTSGRALIGGHDLAKEPLAVKKLCGLAAQNLNLDGELSVRENLEIHGLLFGMNGTDRQERSQELLKYVDMSERADSLVKTLSGGLKRRLMIARALLHRPRLLFLDEPTVGLDPAIRRRLWGLIRKIRQDGVTVFLTTHYIEEAEFLADRVAFIHRGRLVNQGTPPELMAALGAWAVDRFNDAGIETRYFQTREEARNHLSENEFEGTLRRVNLEDAFLAQTGKRVAE